jgi:outer membrane protein TolC
MIFIVRSYTMMNRICFFFICGLFSAALFVPGPYAQDYDVDRQGHRTWRIGIVTDGSTPADQAIVRLFKKEISTMMEQEFDVRFPENMILSGKDTGQGVRKALNRLFSSSGPDIILALGVISSTEVLERESIPKPVVAPYIADFALKGRKKKGAASGIRNLTYIDSMYYLDQDVETFRKIVPFKHIAIFLDRRMVNSFPNIDNLVEAFAARHDLSVSIVSADTSAGEVLQSIPAGVDAVMVGPLWHFDQEQKRLLARGLIEKRIPGFSIWNISQVEQGLLAGLESEEKQDILARRTAVAVMDILQGEKPSSVDVEFLRGRRLTINMATARALDIYPSVLTLTGANVINEQRTDIKRHLNIQKAVDEAVAANLRLQSADTTVKAGRHAINEAKADLLPRIDIGTGASVIDQDRAKAGGGMTPERAWTGTAGGTVLLYSDQKWARYTAEGHIQKAREMNRDKVRLDVTYDAAVAYLNVLRSRTIERIYKENLKLTDANLERAQIKVATGAAGPDEVYRWESKFANDRRQVLYRESDIMDAMEAMNRILHRPLQELFVPEEATLKDPLFIMGDRFFFQLMENPGYLRKFKNFAVKEAIELRPELKGFEAAIKARERLKTAAKRAYWLPDFTVEGGVDQYFADDGSGQRDDGFADLDDTDWSVGVYARIPLFEGGKKGARVGRLQEEITRLSIDRSAEAEAIVQNVLASINRTRASYPSISLSRDAAESGRLNLDLVTDSYVQGIKSIIDLLDAQNQSLSADLDAANAVYNFLIDFMGVERAIGEFVTFMPEDRRQEWRKKVHTAIRSK